MRSAFYEQALDLALELPAAERAGLAHELLASLDAPADPDAAQAWEAEITRRLHELAAGQAQTLEAEETLRRIDARLGRPR